MNREDWDMRQRMGRAGALALLAIAALPLASCATWGGSRRNAGDMGAYQPVQTFDMASRRIGDVSDPTRDIPLSAVIQPEDLYTSPVIDIETLREREAPTARVVRSSAELLEEAREKAEQGVVLSEVDALHVDGGVNTGDLAAEASEKAFTHATDSTDYTESVLSYDYIPGRIYEIIASPGAITDFRLRPGESISGSPAITDSVDWQFTMGTSLEDGVTVQHLFIRPLKTGLDTSMVVLTDQRTYYFRMASFTKDHMTALRFRYPVRMEDGSYVDESVAQRMVDVSSGPEGGTMVLADLDYDYAVERYRGKPNWVPESVFSDSRKTYFQLPSAIENTDDMPTVYILRDGRQNLVNYRQVGNILVVDSIIGGNGQCWLLKQSEKEQVRVYRK